MNLWKYTLMIAVVAGGFGTGYLCRQREPIRCVQIQTQPPAGAAAPGYDPSLIVPPPDVDSKGVFLDPPLDELRNQFRKQMGFETNASETTRGDASWLIPVEATSDLPAPDQVPATLPPSLRRRTSSGEAPLSTTPARFQHRPAGLRVYTNRRDIRLNFEVARQCAAGIKAVELWCRRSPDASYECVDRMEGCKSPFVTRLWSEGDYEFRLVLVDGLGVKTSLTHEDLPDICVCLDTTPPIIEMQRPVLDGAGVVKLNWLAGDRNLDELPISLEYTEDGKSWKSLTADEWQPNTGEYLWVPPAGLSDKVRFRILARDTAGNIAMAPAPSKSERFDYTLPEARINGFIETLPEPRDLGVVERNKRHANVGTLEVLPAPIAIAP